MTEPSYRFFANTSCECYPCHPELEEQNCLFCFCPLYGVHECSPIYEFTPSGIKDCSKCLFPHKPENYDLVIGKLIQK